MRESSGSPEYPIWLVADSPPKNWESQLSVPLDSRHPARHNIWTSVLDCMQAELFRNGKRRFDGDRLYIRNAVIRAGDKPTSSATLWSPELSEQVDGMTIRLQKHRPQVVLSFGAFAFEFMRRANAESVLRPFGYWGTERLGWEFRKRIGISDPDPATLIPLLHVSISWGNFLKSHQYFVHSEPPEEANYFEFVGKDLARLLLERLSSEAIWVQ